MRKRSEEQEEAEHASAAPGPLIPCQRHLFDIPRGVAWLNCAYMSPLLQASVAAGITGIERKARPWTIAPPDFFAEPERVRLLFAQLMGVEDDSIAIVPSASYGIAVAARNIASRSGEEIIVLEDQFPSNYYSWQRRAEQTGGRLRVIRRTEALSAEGEVDWASAIAAAIGPSTTIVALANCLWTDGSLIDLEKVALKAREHSAALVLDLTQSAGALPIDLSVIRPDFAVAASYKWLLGPYSLGFLYVAPQHREAVPLEENWIARAGSENFSRLVDYVTDYQPGARRFDMGERSNFHLMPIVEVALSQLLEWGVERVAATLGARNRSIAERARRLGFEVVGEKGRAPHFLGLRSRRGLPPDLPARLAAEDVHVSMRGDSIRVTPHLWTDDEDVDRFFALIETVLA